jgi:hypothetical protein
VKPTAPQHRHDATLAVRLTLISMLMESTAALAEFTRSNP